MDSGILISIVAGVIALIVGIILGKLIFAKDTRKQVEDARAALQKLNNRLKK